MIPSEQFNLEKTKSNGNTCKWSQIWQENSNCFIIIIIFICELHGTKMWMPKMNMSRGGKGREEDWFKNWTIVGFLLNSIPRKKAIHIPCTNDDNDGEIAVFMPNLAPIACVSTELNRTCDNNHILIQLDKKGTYIKINKITLH